MIKLKFGNQTILFGLRHTSIFFTNLQLIGKLINHITINNYKDKEKLYPTSILLHYSIVF